jgi:hypothetical protein
MTYGADATDPKSLPDFLHRLASCAIALILWSLVVMAVGTVIWMVAAGRNGIMLGQVSVYVE